MAYTESSAEIGQTGGFIGVKEYLFIFIPLPCVKPQPS